MTIQDRQTSPSVRRSSGTPGFFQSIGIGLCSILAFYCLLSIFAGNAGLVSQSTLRAQINEMEEKAGELRDTNTRLSSEVKALMSDPGRMAREARKIGYLKPEETEILLVGMSDGEDVRSASDGAGIEDVLRVGEVAGLPDLLVKEISLVVGFGFFLVLWLMRTTARSARAMNAVLKQSEGSPEAETA